MRRQPSRHESGTVLCVSVVRRRTSLDATRVAATAGALHQHGTYAHLPANRPCDCPTCPRNCGPSTLAVHAGEERQKLGNSITDPIVCAATYTFANTQAVIDYIEQDQPREEYGRYGNPGERVVERKLAALEGGEEAVLFATGMAAIVGLLMAKLNAGRRSDLLRRVLPPQPRVLCQAPVAVRRRHAAGQGLRLRRHGSGHQSSARGC